MQFSPLPVNWKALLLLFTCVLLVSRTLHAEPGPETDTATGPSQKASLKLAISGIKVASGTLYLALHNYDSENWLIEPVLKEKLKVGQAGLLTHTISSVPFGRYALRLYHDENDNEQLDRNESGLPIEPFGFSQDDGSVVKENNLPILQNAVFAVDQDIETLEIALLQLDQQKRQGN